MKHWDDPFQTVFFWGGMVYDGFPHIKLVFSVQLPGRCFTPGDGDPWAHRAPRWPSGFATEKMAILKRMELINDDTLWWTNIAMENGHL